MMNSQTGKIIFKNVLTGLVSGRVVLCFPVVRDCCLQSVIATNSNLPMDNKLEETSPSINRGAGSKSSIVALNFIVIYKIGWGLVSIIASFWMAFNDVDGATWISTLVVGLMFLILGLGIWYRIEMARKITLILYWLSLVLLGMAFLIGLPGAVSSSDFEFSLLSTIKSVLWLFLFFVIVKSLHAKDVISQFPSNRNYVAAMTDDGAPLPGNSEKSTLIVSILICFVVGMSAGGIVAFNIYYYVYLPTIIESEPIV
jgi:hypothetical protein